MHYDPGMVTHEQLREYLGRKPFVPFRLVLKNGESVDVMRFGQAATLNRRIFVGGEENQYRWIWHEQIDHVETPELKIS